MSNRCINFNVPPSLLRLGVDDFEYLLVLGLYRNISREDIHERILERPDITRRTARAILRMVCDDDLSSFNAVLADLRDRFLPTDRLRIRTDYITKVCNINKLGS